MADCLEKILVVDDEDPIRRLLSHSLKLSGYQVSEASDGEDALNKIRPPDYVPDLVITDLNMPIMDGMGLLNAIMGRNRREDLDIKVIMLTGQGSEEKAVEALQLGASFYATKPIKNTLLLGAVKKALADQKERREEQKEWRENCIYDTMLDRATSHNINNAASPCGILEMIGEYTAGTPISMEDLKWINVSHSSVQRILTFLRDKENVLRKGLKYTSFNLGGLILGTMAEDTAKEYLRAEWDFTGPPNPIKIEADREKLAAVVRNMSLDITYNPHSLSPGISIAEEGGCATIRFSYQLNGRKTLYGEDTCSGLPCARKFAQQHGGEYRLITGENGNEAVEIRIPLKKSPP